MAKKASAAVTLSSIRDLQSCTRYYLLQSSTLATPSKPTAKPPGGSWATTEPSYTAGSTNSLYFCDLNVFTDGDFAYSDVSLSSSYEAAKAAYNRAVAAEREAAQALSSTECIVGTQTASTNVWTGRASFASLADGQAILYWLPFAGTSTAATLNLTLSGGDTTGAKNVYINSATRCTTHIAAGNMVQMVYRQDVVIGGASYTGWWIGRALNENTYDRVRFSNTIRAKTAISASRLIVSDGSGFYHLAAGVPFSVNLPILWAGSALSVNATGTNNFLSYPSCSLRNNAGDGWSGIQYATVYLAGNLNRDVFTAASDSWLTTTPNDSDLTYISLGFMYSTYQMYLYPEHPMFRLVNGILTAVSQLAFEARVAAEQAQETADEALDIAQIALSHSEVIVGTQVAKTGAWTGVASFAGLRDGQQIAYWLPYAGSGDATLNLTLSDGSTTGRKNCYYSGATRLSTQYAAGNMIHLTYRVNANVNGVSYTGWWADANYNVDTYDRIRFNNSVTAKTAIAAAHLITGDDDGFFHLSGGVPFDVNKPILYAVNAIVANTTGSHNYLSYPSIEMRTTLGDTSWMADKGKTLYLAGTLSGSTFIPLAANWLTTAPVDEPAMTFIALGYMYSNHQIYLYPEHPMYRMVDGELRAVTQLAYEAQIAAIAAQATADAARADFRRVVRIDNDGLHVGDNQSGGEVLIDSESVNVVMNGSKYSRFAGNYVQFGNYQLRRTTDGGLAFKMTDI